MSAEKEKPNTSGEQNQPGFIDRVVSALRSAAAYVFPSYFHETMNQLSSDDRPDWKKKTFDSVSRAFDSPTVAKDFPRLAKRVIFIDRRSCAPDVAPCTPEALGISGATLSAEDASIYSYCSFEDLLSTLFSLTGGEPARVQALRDRFESKVVCGVDYGTQKGLIMEVLDEFCGKDSSAGVCLKTLSQAATAPAMTELRGAIVVDRTGKNVMPLALRDGSDNPLVVVFIVEDERVRILHKRKQIYKRGGNAQEEVDMSFMCDVEFVVSRKEGGLGELVDVNMTFEDICFSDSFQGPLRDGLEKELKKREKKPTDDDDWKESDSTHTYLVLELAKHTSEEYKKKKKLKDEQKDGDDSK